MPSEAVHVAEYGTPTCVGPDVGVHETLRIWAKASEGSAARASAERLSASTNVRRRGRRRPLGRWTRLVLAGSQPGNACPAYFLDGHVRPRPGSRGSMYIEQFALIVTDYDEAIRFFVEVLGFELVEDSPAVTTEGGRPKRWVVVRPPGAATSLLLA